ncbi:sugar phosphate permease [Acinetobacter calcoaceticus]|uniref:Sugar phosphate permease n=1 Tax=Acinetobacter calcoaceticus TaxID=471 RepID=A0A4R1XHQ1_ACICA|nr:sugar phosphate permease [Acinetobacter calcoaceticus]
MKTTRTLDADSLVVEPTNERQHTRKIALATIVGTTIEWYDYFIYAAVAGLVFNELFFKPAGPQFATLLVFASVGISFIFRPFGAFIAGYFGDKNGRKNVLAITLIMMGCTTTIIGLMPTYDQIGIAAPIILIMLRILQGISAGGEWGGAVLMAVEHAPAKKRGLFSAFPQLGVPLGLLLASIVLVIMTGYVSPGEAFLEWGWRVPFLLSIFLFGLGYWIRRSVDESPVFEELKTKGTVQKPIRRLFKDYKTVVFTSALLIAGTTTLGYMTAGGFVQNYTTNPKGLNLDRPVILALVGVSALVWTFFTWLSASLSDRYGRKPIYIIGSVIQIVAALTLFPLMSTGSYLYIAIGLVILSISIGMTYGVQAIFYSELFPASIRFSGISITYAIGSIMGGAFAPLIAAYLTGHQGGIVGVTFYLTAMAIIALIAICLLKDRTGVDLSPKAESDQPESFFIWK